SREEPMANSVQSGKRAHRASVAVVWSAVMACGMCVFATGIAAQTYPSKIIKFVVPLSAGSPIDVIARMVAPPLSSRLKQTIIVENRPGGGTTIGTRAIANAASDGHTLLFTGATHTLGPALVKNLGYDPVKDFAPVAMVGSVPWMLVVTPS